MTNDNDQAFQADSAACQEKARLRDELAKVKGKLLVADSLWQTKDQEIACLKDALAVARERLGTLEPLVGSPACQKFMEALAERDNLKSELAQAQARIDQLQAENAKLAAAMADSKHSLGCPWWEHKPCACHKSIKYDAALRDRLGPTVELIREAKDNARASRAESDISHDRRNYRADLEIRLEQELARLRAVMGEKGTK